MTTMNEKYGDGSEHEACERCGYCVDCGDCTCIRSAILPDEQTRLCMEKLRPDALRKAVARDIKLLRKYRF